MLAPLPEVQIFINSILYSPLKQIKLIKNKGGFFNQEFDDYNVYDNNGKLLFIATPEVAGDTSSFINRIIIRDTSFKTLEGIGLNSNLGQIRDAYHNINYLPSSGEIVVSVPKVSTSFLINKATLDDSWWDNTTNQIIEKNIPDSAQIDGIVVFWNTKEAQHIPAVFTAAFWNEMLTKLITWCVIQLPVNRLFSLFYSFLITRALRFTTRKMKKLAINKAHKTENIDNNEAEKRINTLTGDHIRYRKNLPLGDLPTDLTRKIQYQHRPHPRQCRNCRISSRFRGSRISTGFHIRFLYSLGRSATHRRLGR